MGCSLQLASNSFLPASFLYLEEGTSGYELGSWGRGVLSMEVVMSLQWES